ncbi:MAG: membrane protein insertion efficiency factor YidD [bacterium]|nr:membrane protein insertion efficiency factor YidD [bacterium]
MIRLLLFGIRLYQRFISPLYPRSCRFYPSCSDYAYQAISKYGKRGLKKAIKRLLSCHPFHSGGINQVD